MLNHSIAIIIVTAIDLLLYCFSIFVKPDWSVKLNWKKLNIISITLTIIFTMILSANLKLNNEIVYTVTLGSFSIIFYNFVQGLWSDLKLRLVDRRIQYLSILLLLSSNISVLAYYKLESTLNLYIVFSLFFAIFMFTPKLMGASDGRALLMGVAGLYPILGVEYFPNVFKVVFMILLLYTFALIIVESVREKRLVLTAFKGKVSFAAVPIILFSFLCTGVFYII